jgi:hypothetical protein
MDLPSLGIGSYLRDHSPRWHPIPRLLALTISIDAGIASSLPSRGTDKHIRGGECVALTSCSLRCVIVPNAARPLGNFFRSSGCIPVSVGRGVSGEEGISSRLCNGAETIVRVIVPVRGKLAPRICRERFSHRIEALTWMDTAEGQRAIASARVLSQIRSRDERVAGLRYALMQRAARIARRAIAADCRHISPGVYASCESTRCHLRSPGHWQRT